MRRYPLFPTTPILDTCERDNESPASGWEDPLFTGGFDDPLQILNNALTGTSGTSSAFLSKNPGSGFTEMYCTFDETTINDGVELYIEMSGVDGNGYALFCSEGWALSTYKTTNGSNAQMGVDVEGVTVTNGDSVGFRRRSLREFEIWYKEAGGIWQLVATRFDTGTPHPMGGILGMIFYGSTQKVTNVGGGRVRWPIKTFSGRSARSTGSTRTDN